MEGESGKEEREHVFGKMLSVSPSSLAPLLPSYNYIPYACIQEVQDDFSILYKLHFHHV